MPGPPRFRPASSREETGKNRTVWVLRSGTPESVDIVIGASDGRRTEVVSGALGADAAVVVSHATPKS
jgi:HlyD family secretion protein